MKRKVKLKKLKKRIKLQKELAKHFKDFYLRIYGGTGFINFLKEFYPELLKKESEEEESQIKWRVK